MVVFGLNTGSIEIHNLIIYLLRNIFIHTNHKFDALYPTRQVFIFVFIYFNFFFAAKELVLFIILKSEEKWRYCDGGRAARGSCIYKSSP